MRKLASIQRIDALEPIAGKDRIVLATILGWHVIVQKSEFNVGDSCVYCEIDSVMPDWKPEFAFLEKRGYRIKTMKMAGVISQGIAFPLSILPEGKQYNIGDDVTEILGIKKYEEPDPEPIRTMKPHKKKWYEKTPLMRFGWFRRLFEQKKCSKAFPTKYVSKTDENRIQTVPWMLKSKDGPWVLTEKVDGTSGTFLMVKHGRKYEYYVCSRNLRLPENDGSIYWQVSDKYKLDTVLKKLLGETHGEWIAIQGECIGPSIQKNKYKRSTPEFYAFNVITPEKRLGSVAAKDILKRFDINFVPIVGIAEVLPENVDDMLAKAHGKSVLNPNTLREGLVVRSWDGQQSFKAVDPEFLLKWNE